MAFHLLLLLIGFSVWETKASSKTPCPSTCGDFYINYPFGIREACYFNKAFEVTCENSSGSEKPFLISMQGELQPIQPYPSYTVSVNISLNSINSSIAEGFNLSGNFFSFPKEFNRLAAIGCDNYSSINQIYNNPNNITGECMYFSNCDPTQNRTACYDFICEIPENPMFDKASLSINLQGCRSAFMVDQYWLESNYLPNRDALVKRKDHESVPIRLEWGKRKGGCVELYNSDTTFCNADDYCLIQLSSDYYCLCSLPRSDSYRGCEGDLIYNMTSGYSYSDCPDGYSPYTSEYYQEPMCNSSKSFDIILVKKSWVKFFVIIGFNAGLGMLLLVIGSWWLYKFIIRRKAIKLKQKFFKRNGGLLLQQHLSSTKGNFEKTNLFTSTELERATDNYNANRILGQGGQGTVYKGMLAEGKS